MPVNKMTCRDEILCTRAFELGQGWHEGTSVGLLFREYPALRKWGADRLAAELAAMQTDRLVRPLPAAPGENTDDAHRPWTATDAGRRARERVLQVQGLRSACLAEQQKHDLNDLVLAIAAGPHCQSQPGRHVQPQERYLPFYLHRREPAEIQSAVRQLIDQGHLDPPLPGPADPLRTLRVTAAGIEHYEKVVRSRLGIAEGRTILDPQAEPEDEVETQLRDLCSDHRWGDALALRWREGRTCEEAGCHLAATAIYGSVLEGLLLAMAEQNPQVARRAKAAPPGKKNGNVLPFGKWRFTDLIAVAREVGWLSGAVLKYTDNLRDSRNLLHPWKQIEEAAVADKHASKIAREIVREVVGAAAERITQRPTPGSSASKPT